MRPTPPLRSRRRALNVLKSLRQNGLRAVWSRVWRGDGVVRRYGCGERNAPGPSEGSRASRSDQTRCQRPASKSPTPDIAVIVTSLNRARLLRLALRSVQLQDLDRWECIVVDDGSLDDSVIVAQSFASIDPRFRVVRHDRNRGLSAARNTGLADVRAPLVCFLDDDDLLLQSSLSSRLGALTGQPADVAGAFCDWVGIDPEDRLGPFAATADPAGAARGPRTATSLPERRSSPPVRCSEPTCCARSAASTRNSSEPKTSTCGCVSREPDTGSSTPTASGSGTAGRQGRWSSAHPRSSSTA